MDDWPVIYSYSRADALADGVLVDISKLARESGFCFPTAVTQSTWVQIITPSDKARKELAQSEAGRIWDILACLRAAIMQARENRITFSVLVDDFPKQTHQLSAVCGPGDAGEATITIMRIWED